MGEWDALWTMRSRGRVCGDKLIKDNEIEKTNGSPAGHSSSALSPGFPMAAGLTGEREMLRNSQSQRHAA